jgi:hypothetical protein
VSPSLVWAILPCMTSYFNRTVLGDLFSDVELKPGTEDRLAAIRRLEDEFAGLAAESLERIAYDLATRGWTVAQIAHEIRVGRDYIPRMAGRYAARRGLLSPFATTRSYEGAVDISRLVSRAIREAGPEGAPQPRRRSGDASPTTA